MLKIKSPKLTRQDMAELAARAKAGDVEAAQTLLMSVVPLIQKLAARSCRKRPWLDFDNLFQDACAYLFKRLRNGDYDPHWTVGTFAGPCVLHAVCLQGRHKGREPGELVEWKLVADRRDGELAESENRADVAGLLGRLPPRERAVLRLRFFDGLLLREAAQRLGVCSRERVRQIESRALDRCRKLLGLIPAAPTKYVNRKVAAAAPEALRLIGQGKSDREVARCTGISRGTVGRLRREAGTAGAA